MTTTNNLPIHYHEATSDCSAVWVVGNDPLAHQSVPKLKAKNGRYTVCLNMIAKNEKHVIAEGIKTLLKYIDYWIISDTGSTDGMQQYVVKLMAQFGVPGELYQDDWPDHFGKARSKALKYCHNRFNWAFVHDADDLLCGQLVEIPKWRQVGSVRFTIGSDVKYWRPQLFNLAFPWCYRAVVHEFAYCDNLDETKVQTLSMSEHGYIDSRRLGDRNKSKNKYDRDCEGLEREIAAIRANPKTHPDRDLLPRYLYYLGQSYVSGDKPEKAIAPLKERLESKHWFEEHFQSALLLGRAMMKCRQAPVPPEIDFHDVLVSAHEECPQRVESLFTLAEYYWVNNNYRKTLALTTKGVDTPYPDTLSLFLEKEVYDYKMRVLHIKAAFKENKKDIVLKYGHYLLYEFEEFVTNTSLAQEAQAISSLYAQAYFEKPKEIKYPVKAVSQLRGQCKILADRQLSVSVAMYIRATDTVAIVQQSINSFLTCAQDLDSVNAWRVYYTAFIDEDMKKQLQTLYPFTTFCETKHFFPQAVKDAQETSGFLLLLPIASAYFMHNFAPIRFARAIFADNETVGQVLLNPKYSTTLYQIYQIKGMVLKHVDKYILHSKDPSIKGRLNYWLHNYTAVVSKECTGTVHCTSWPHLATTLPSVLNLKSLKDLPKNGTELEYAQHYTQSLKLKTAALTHSFWHDTETLAEHLKDTKETTYPSQYILYTEETSIPWPTSKIDARYTISEECAQVIAESKPYSMPVPIPGWHFFMTKDSFGHDCAQKTLTRKNIASVIKENPLAVAINTLGYIKTHIEPIEKWIPLEKPNGMWVKHTEFTKTMDLPPMITDFEYVPFWTLQTAQASNSIFPDTVDIASNTVCITTTGQHTTLAKISSWVASTHPKAGMYVRKDVYVALHA